MDINSTDARCSAAGEQIVKGCGHHFKTCREPQAGLRQRENRTRRNKVCYLSCRKVKLRDTPTRFTRQPTIYIMK